MARLARFGLVGLCVLVLAACGNSGPSGGGANIGVTIQSLSAADVASVTVTVTGPGIAAPMTQSLSKTGGQWTGYITGIPVGTDRVFDAAGYDASNTLIYAGKATGVTITPGPAALVLITLQELDPPPPFGNSVPVIDAVVASTSGIIPGGVVALTVNAHDPDGDPITYAWTATAGTFDNAASTTPNWTAPAINGSVTLTITVSDPKAATRSVSLVIDVNTSYSNYAGAASINAQFNNWPVVSSLGATPGHLAAGQTTTLALAATDPDGDPLSFSWTAGACSGGFSSSTVQSPTWTFGGCPTGATACSCTLKVSVADGRGLTTGSITILCGPSVTGTFPPKIDSTFQSTTTCKPGDPVLLRVVASDSQGQALTVAWSAATGTLGTPTSTATQSEVTWTAPAAGCTHAIVATVSNTGGGQTSHSFSVGTCALCGNGTLDPGEQCDGASLGGADCASLGYGGGTLKCAPDCSFELGGCTSPPELCGNGAIDPGEKCDTKIPAGTPGSCPSAAACNDADKCTVDKVVGVDCAATCTHSKITAPINGDGCCPPGANSLTDTDCSATCNNGVLEGKEECDGSVPAGVTCQGKGYAGGTLVCTTGCMLDVSGCYKCGDNKINGPAGTEKCDGMDVGGKTCKDFGYVGGVLGCKADCTWFDTTKCSSTCGNNLLEMGEQCDGAALGGETCASRGFFTGTLACNTATCTFNTGACNNCGSGQLDAGESCDIAIPAGQAGACPTSCTDGAVCTKDVVVGSGCAATCTYTPITQPISGDGCCPPGANANNDTDCTPACQNGVAEIGEECDKKDLGGQTCTGLGYEGGLLYCDANCKLYKYYCYKCGDGKMNGTEECDTYDLGGLTCKTLGHYSGSLFCNSNCTYNTTYCLRCGDGTINGPEQCDGIAFWVWDTCSSLGFDGGTLSCTPYCTHNTAGCYKCGDGVKNGYEKCDGYDLGGYTCTSLGSHDPTHLPCR